MERDEGSLGNKTGPTATETRTVGMIQSQRLGQPGNPTGLEATNSRLESKPPVAYTDAPGLGLVVRNSLQAVAKNARALVSRSSSVMGTRHSGPDQLTETPGTKLDLFGPKDAVAPDLSAQRSFLAFLVLVLVLTLPGLRPSNHHQPEVGSLVSCFAHQFTLIPSLLLSASS